MYLLIDEFENMLFCDVLKEETWEEIKNGTTIAIDIESKKYFNNDKNKWEDIVVIYNNKEACNGNYECRYKRSKNKN